MSGRESAEKTFWKTPELVDKLIPFLDVESVARLAEAHQLTAQVLEDATSSWNTLVKRNCPYYEHVEEFSYWAKNYHDCVKERVSKEDSISQLTRILKKMENPKVPLLELLHVICNRFPPVIFKPTLENGRPMAFHLSSGLEPSPCFYNFLARTTFVLESLLEAKILARMLFWGDFVFNSSNS